MFFSSYSFQISVLPVVTTIRTQTCNAFYRRSCKALKPPEISEVGKYCWSFLQAEEHLPPALTSLSRCCILQRSVFAGNHLLSCIPPIQSCHGKPSTLASQSICKATCQNNPSSVWCSPVSDTWPIPFSLAYRCSLLAGAPQGMPAIIS